MRITGLYPGANPGEYPATFWLNDSCVLREGRPFFVPDWDESFKLHPMLALRLSKVGKGIARRFASRYLTSISLWLHARAETTLRALSAKGLPLTSALAFDASLLPSPWVPLELEDPDKLSYLIDSQEYSLPGSPTPGEFLEKISERNTMRTGDILLLPLSGPAIQAIPGNNIESAILLKGATAPAMSMIHKIR